MELVCGGRLGQLVYSGLEGQYAASLVNSSITNCHVTMDGLDVII